MAGCRDFRKHKWLCFSVCAVMIPFIVLYNKAIKHKKYVGRREILISTEIPAEHLDSASLDLALLVNTLINTTHTGSQQYFSLLSVASHSSFALSKMTVLVYNKFTGILLDVMGNSSTYLHELFKSSSILSVSQHNDSDCVYICVMAGKTDGDLTHLWEMEASKPLFNQTITADVHKGNTTLLPLVVEWYHLATSSSVGSKHDGTWSHTIESITAPGITSAHEPVPERSQKDAGCPWRKSDWAPGGAGRIEPVPTRTSTGASSTTGTQKLHRCLLDLCKFFSQCLCRGYSRPGMARFCIENHTWYLKNTVQVCRRVKRISSSRSLKQKCLERMCSKR